MWSQPCDCPHCRHQIFCKVFRHAQFKSVPKGKGAAPLSSSYVNPHAPKAECDRWVRDGLIHGCGKPFKFDGETVEVCGYI